MKEVGFPPGALGRQGRILRRGEARPDLHFRWLLRLQCEVCIRGDDMEARRLAVTGAENGGLDEGDSSEGKDSPKERWTHSKGISLDLGKRSGEAAFRMLAWAAGGW